MTAPGAATVATGSFYNIDRTGTGNVTIYRQADGRYSLRLDDFFVSPNSDLEIRLSTCSMTTVAPLPVDAVARQVHSWSCAAGRSP